MATIKSTGPNPLNPSEESEFVINVPDETMAEVVAAICAEFVYPSTVENPGYDMNIPESPMQIPNPEGPGTFAWKQTVAWWSGIVKQHQYRQRQVGLDQQLTEEITEKLNAIQYGSEQ